MFIRTTLLWILTIGSAFAMSGDEVIAKMDKEINKSPDAFNKFQCITQEPGKKPREMVFEVRLQGEKRLVEFLAPGDMKGTKVLS